jgi:NAD-dependent SIR2 family protein deacetylase
VVFFGEKLPDGFFDTFDIVKESDLVIVIGTALAVAPFNMLVEMAEDNVHKVLINRENTA